MALNRGMTVNDYRAGGRMGVIEHPSHGVPAYPHRHAVPEYRVLSRTIKGESTDFGDDGDAIGDTTVAQPYAILIATTDSLHGDVQKFGERDGTDRPLGTYQNAAVQHPAFLLATQCYDVVQLLSFRLQLQIPITDSFDFHSTPIGIVCYSGSVDAFDAVAFPITQFLEAITTRLGVGDMTALGDLKRVSESNDGIQYRGCKLYQDEMQTLSISDANSHFANDAVNKYRCISLDSGDVDCIGMLAQHVPPTDLFSTHVAGLNSFTTRLSHATPDTGLPSAYTTTEEPNFQWTTDGVTLNLKPVVRWYVFSLTGTNLASTIFSDSSATFPATFVLSQRWMFRQRKHFL